MLPSNNCFFIVLVLLVTSYTSPYESWAEIYKHTDNDGTTLYTNDPPTNDYELHLSIQSRQEDDQHVINGPSEELETRVRIDKNAVIVPVLLGYGGKEIKAMLLLDTGASNIVLHRALGEELSIQTKSGSKARIVGGKTIDTDIGTLDYIKVGPHKKKNLRVGIIDLAGEPVPYKGLLGMNFLKGLDYKIDFDNKIIKWKP
ncbi:MAG: hypothetical protein GY864_11930 [Desulfobacterales bacterium]|nr:hypothetical protein [Desulfobacterales bacterium]